MATPLALAIEEYADEKDCDVPITIEPTGRITFTDEYDGENISDHAVHMTLIRKWHMAAESETLGEFLATKYENWSQGPIYTVYSAQIYKEENVKWLVDLFWFDMEEDCDLLECLAEAERDDAEFLEDYDDDE